MKNTIDAEIEMDSFLMFQRLLPFKDIFLFTLDTFICICKAKQFEIENK